ncbi:2-isopropylmalate synthase [Lentzea jiangxiensis]|uniref:2-isopropylmalate synthase n=1 Tax=Lentzea jiangxiensis TaxID=641025 RepID=A0A1H0LZJ9_9PSEU|nr:2-isopropylmalate synthase [Lentzea jiangxiensis]SDO73461.1 2-isopropylmalate synthase [Lentzea jiangxiensis]
MIAEPDVVRESALAGKVVLWEESARDGAQGKTLMSPDFRVWLAREQGAMFGEDGPRHVVFAAGFPAVCKEEFEAVRRVAVEAEGTVSPAAVCRGTAADVRQAIASVHGIAHARVMLVVPASEAMAEVMTHRRAAEAVRVGAALVSDSLGAGVAVDVCLADASRADHGLLADAARELTAAGAGVVFLADTVGDQLPAESGAMFAAARSEGVVLASHAHNDLGLGLANTLEALSSGARVVSSSWLGVAERSGLVATEQVLFLLAYRADRTKVLLGEDADAWSTPPDLTRLPGLAQAVAEEIGVPLGVTTPVVGTGVGTISTGTPFVHPELFQPFAPEQLGITPSVVLTHLASARVVTAVAGRLGHELDVTGARAAMAWVKSRAYQQGHAVVDDQAFAHYLDGMRAGAGQR